MSTRDHTTPVPPINLNDPATWLAPGEPLMAGGYDWSWCYVQFAEVPGYPGYAVSTAGTAWCCRKLGKHAGLTDQWRRLKLCPDSTEYLGFRVSLNNRGQRLRIHSLILTCFIGPAPPGHESLHYNGDRQDNRLANLRWGTRSQNMKDAVRHGTHVRGPGKDKLTDDQVREIRELGRRGKFGTEIAPMFGISPSHANMILRGVTRVNVD